MLAAPRRSRLVERTGCSALPIPMSSVSLRVATIPRDESGRMGTRFRFSLSTSEGEAVMDFPLLPHERRYHMRLERSRTRDPPSRTPPESALRLWPDSASFAAGKILRRWLWRGGYRRTPRKPTARFDVMVCVRRFLPRAAASPMCFLLAATFLPIGLLICYLGRHDLKGRWLRARQITPMDVRLALWDGKRSLRFLMRRFLA